MVNKKLLLGILVILLVFGMVIIGCDDNDSTNGLDNRLILEDGYAWVNNNEPSGSRLCFIFKENGILEVYRENGTVNVWISEGTSTWSTKNNNSLTIEGKGTSSYTVTSTTLISGGDTLTKMAVSI